MPTIELTATELHAKISRKQARIENEVSEIRRAIHRLKEAGIKAGSRDIEILKTEILDCYEEIDRLEALRPVTP